MITTICNYIVITLSFVSAFFYLRLLKRHLKIKQIIDERIELEEKLLTEINEQLEQLKATRVIHRVISN